MARRSEMMLVDMTYCDSCGRNAWANSNCVHGIYGLDLCDGWFIGGRNKGHEHDMRCVEKAKYDICVAAGDRDLN